MKKSIRLKNLGDVSTKALFTGNSKKSDIEHAKKDAILSDLFRRLVKGEIDIVEPVKKEKVVYTLTRSTRSVGIVKTCFWMIDGELSPTSHTECNDIDRLLREGMPSGVYDIITL